MPADGWLKLPRPCPCGVDVARLRVREGRGYWWMCCDCDRPVRAAWMDELGDGVEPTIKSVVEDG